MVAFIDTNSREFRQAVGQGFSTHLMAVAYFVHKATMDKLVRSGHYGSLSVAYAGYVSLLAERDYPPGELAASLGVSKQSCSKTIRELEQRGFIQRRKNPEDSRSSLLSLTPAGLQLLRDGMRASDEIHREFTDLLGEQRLQALIRALEHLRVGLGIEQPAYLGLPATTRVQAGGTTRRLHVLLPLLNAHFHHALHSALEARGYADLKTSHGQVLGLVSRGGRHINDMADLLGISKQAVALTAAELVKLGYIVREPDPHDRRQVLLRLSAEGEKLLSEAVDCVASLEASIEALLGEAEFRMLEDTVETIYLHTTALLDMAMAPPARIKQLCSDLVEELGAAGARALARELMTVTRGTA